MNKKIWNKLTKYQQMLWTVLNDRFKKELKCCPSTRVQLVDDPTLEVIAHNLALIAVWEVGKNKVTIK